MGSSPITPILSSQVQDIRRAEVLKRNYTFSLSLEKGRFPPELPGPDCPLGLLRTSQPLPPSRLSENSAFICSFNMC